MRAVVVAVLVGSSVPAWVDGGEVQPHLLRPAVERYGSTPSTPLPVAARRTCKSVYSCREAVLLWCGGYRRADGDGDGIPCENVCSSRREVDEIRAEIGC